LPCEASVLGFGFELYSIVKVQFNFQLHHPTKGTIVMLDTLIVLYKRGFRKEKEVITFLFKAKNGKIACNLGLNLCPYQTE